MLASRAQQALQKNGRMRALERTVDMYLGLILILYVGQSCSASPTKKWTDASAVRTGVMHVECRMRQEPNTMTKERGGVGMDNKKALSVDENQAAHLRRAAASRCWRPRDRHQDQSSRGPAEFVVHATVQEATEEAVEMSTTATARGRDLCENDGKIECQFVNKVLYCDASYGFPLEVSPFLVTNINKLSCVSY